MRSLISPVPSPFPEINTQVEGVTYSQPMLHKISTGKVLIAGARVNTGKSLLSLFTLTFSVKNDTPAGIYPLSITPITVNNVQGGYSAGGESIPILYSSVIGEADLALAFPALTTSVINRAVTINAEIPDSDKDGIDDGWETAFFGDLTTADSTSDWDGDGYTDLQEYLNQVAGERDPALVVYHPKEVNAPGGTGYNKPGSSPQGFWLMMLPAILNSASAP